MTIDDINHLEGEREDLANRVLELEQELRIQNGMHVRTLCHTESRADMEIQGLRRDLEKAIIENGSLQRKLDGFAQDSRWKDKYDSLLVKIHSVVGNAT
jgi:hypothetical protein